MSEMDKLREQLGLLASMFPNAGLTLQQFYEALQAANFDLERAAAIVRISTAPLGPYDVRLTPRLVCILEQNHHPFITDAKDLAKLDKRMENNESEFGVAHTFDPPHLARVCQRGYFPMAFDIGDDLFVPAVKVHKNRCVVEPARAHVSKQTRKKAGKYTFSVDTAFDQVAALCVKHHGIGWLKPQLVKAFRHLHLHPDQYGTAVHSLELWDKDKKLVAGELGYACGEVYTSLTGAFEVSGGGTIQMAAMSRLLLRTGFKLWDLGMLLPYKLSLGAYTLPRDEFHTRFRALAQLPRRALTAEPACARKVIGPPIDQTMFPPIVKPATPKDKEKAGGKQGGGGNDKRTTVKDKQANDKQGTQSEGKATGKQTTKGTGGGHAADKRHKKRGSVR